MINYCWNLEQLLIFQPQTSIHQVSLRLPFEVRRLFVCFFRFSLQAGAGDSVSGVSIVGIIIVVAGSLFALPLQSAADYTLD